ncbi:TPA: hypothetical protein ACIPUI_001225 [Citrobacter freundii]
MKYLHIIALAFLLAGCSTAAQRMADCQRQGISKDTCYSVEQNRQATLNAAAEKQALENAAQQFTQAAKKNQEIARKKLTGVTFKRGKDGIAYIDDTPAAVDEDNSDATVYSKGINQVIVYKRTGKIALMQSGQFVGYMK